MWQAREIRQEGLGSLRVTLFNGRKGFLQSPIRVMVVFSVNARIFPLRVLAISRKDRWARSGIGTRRSLGKGGSRSPSTLLCDFTPRDLM